MNIHEYQGKEILASHGVVVQRGYIAESVSEAINSAEKILKETKTPIFLVKAQVHAGGRGKGGGIKLAKNIQEVEKFASDMLGMMLITPQTGKEGKRVNKILIAEDVYYPGVSEIKEMYISVLLDRSSNKNMIMYSTEGGVEIEKVAFVFPLLCTQLRVKDFHFYRYKLYHIFFFYYLFYVFFQLTLKKLDILFLYSSIE